MKTIEQGTCGECDHYHTYKNSKEGQGRCLLNPPIPILDNNQFMTFQQPIVSELNVCSHHWTDRGQL